MIFLSFYDRIKVANIIIEELKNNYWNKLKKAYNLIHEPYGYETHIAPEMQEFLKMDYSTTSKHIRFTPDYILSRKISKNNIKTILLEYKVTRTPRYTLGNKQWDNGQIEADAWDNYMNLNNAKVDVAILIYCPYHSRPLLCDYPGEQWITNNRQRPKNSAGSGTEYVNINFKKLRTFDEFMEDEFLISRNITESLLTKQFFHRLKTNPYLTILHHKNSNYKYPIGFNWDKRYCQ